MAVTAEVHRNPDKRRAPFTPDNFHPYRQTQAKKSAGLEVDGKEWVAYLAAGFGLEPIQGN